MGGLLRLTKSPIFRPADRAWLVYVSCYPTGRANEQFQPEKVHSCTEINFFCEEKDRY